VLPRAVVAIVSVVILVAAAPGTVAALNHEHPNAEAASALMRIAMDAHPKVGIDPGDTVVLIDQPHFGAVSVTAMAYHGAGNWRVSYEGVDGFSGVGPASSYVRVPEGWVDHPLFPAGRVRYGLSEAERVAALMQDHADPDLVAARDLWRAAGLDVAAGTLIPDEVLDRFAFSGTPAHVAGQARRVLEAGAARIDFGAPHGLRDAEGVALLGKAVLPRLR
jgi:hypothetical protein